MTILALPVLHIVLATLFVLICLLLMLVILIQKGRGGGLSGAFGGVGGHSPFGAKTGDVFTWVTVALATCFLAMAVGLNFVYRKLPSTIQPPPAAQSAGPVAGEDSSPGPAGAPATQRGS